MLFTCWGSRGAYIFRLLENLLVFVLTTSMQASRESLPSALSDVSETVVPPTQAALVAPVVPQPSGTPAPAAVPATPSKVGCWKKMF